MMNIRTGESTDAAAVARLHAQSWRTAYRGMYRDEYLDGDVFADRTRVWEERLANPPADAVLLLACDGDDLLGFAYAIGGADPQWGTLVDNLHVRAGAQRRGIGRRLLAACAAWSRERYPDALMHLWVLDGNMKARAFYAALGARPHGSELSEAAGGGEVLGWRYVWESFDGLTLPPEPSPA